MSATFASHLGLHAAGLAVATLLAWIWIRATRRDPESHYHLLASVLVAALCLPFVQLAAQGRGGDWLRPWQREAPASASGAVEPSAPSLLVYVDERAPAPEAAPAAAPADLARLLPAVWLAGALAMLAWQLARVRATRRTLAACRPVTDPEVRALWRRVAAGSRRALRARLLEGPHLSSPGCLGLGRRPAVVVPTRALRPGSRAALECALLHELVHLERRDAWLALAESAARTLFWFHPAVWWICRELSSLRETTCDLQVVRRTGRPKSYALSLLTWALGDEARAPASAPTLLHWTHSPSQLRRRIEMLTHPARSTSRLARWSRRALAASCLGAVWSGQIATASMLEGQDESDPNALMAEIVAELAEPSSGPTEAGELPAQLEVPVDREGPGGERVFVRVPGNAFELAPGSSAGARPRLGVHVEPVGGALASQLGLEPGAGLVVKEVEAGSPAERAGLEIHDIIVGLPCGEPVTASRLRDAVHDARGPLQVRVLRHGRERLLQVELGAGEPAPAPRGPEPDGTRTLRLRLRPDGTLDTHALGEHGLHGAIELRLELEGEPLGKVPVFGRLFARGRHDGEEGEGRLERGPVPEPSHAHAWRDRDGGEFRVHPELGSGGILRYRVLLDDEAGREHEAEIEQRVEIDGRLEPPHREHEEGAPIVPDSHELSEQLRRIREEIDALDLDVDLDRVPAEAVEALERAAEALRAAGADEEERIEIEGRRDRLGPILLWRSDGEEKFAPLDLRGEGGERILRLLAGGGAEHADPDGELHFRWRAAPEEVEEVESSAPEPPPAPQKAPRRLRVL